MLDYIYFENYYKMRAIGLSKQQVLGADPNTTEPINFTSNLVQPGNTTCFSLLKKQKKRFFRRNYESFVNVFHNFILFLYNISMK